MLGSSAERPTFQQLTEDFARAIDQTGSVKAEVLFNGFSSDTEVNFLPNNVIIFRRMPYLHSDSPTPPLILVSSSGVFLDEQSTTPAKDELANLIHAFREWDPRQISEIAKEQKDSMEGTTRIIFDMQDLPNYPPGFREYAQKLGEQTGYYTLMGGRLHQLTFAEPEEPELGITLIFSYPNQPTA